jgi:hypothetical protein
VQQPGAQGSGNPPVEKVRRVLSNLILRLFSPHQVALGFEPSSGPHNDLLWLDGIVICSYINTSFLNQLRRTVEAYISGADEMQEQYEIGICKTCPP